MVVALLTGWRGLEPAPWVLADDVLRAAYERGAARRAVAAAFGLWRPRAGLPVPSPEVRSLIRRAVAAVVAAQEATRAASVAPPAALPSSPDPTHHRGAPDAAPRAT